MHNDPLQIVRIIERQEVGYYRVMEGFEADNSTQEPAIIRYDPLRPRIYEDQTVSRRNRKSFLYKLNCTFRCKSQRA